MFWEEYIGLPGFYKGWEVFIGSEQKGKSSNSAVSAQKMLKWLREYMSVDTVTLLLPTENQHLAVHATIGLEEEIAQKIRIPIGQGIAGRIAATMEPMIIENLSEVEVFSPILRQKGLQSLVGIPLPVKKGVVGVLHVGTFQPRQFTERDIQQLQVMAHRLGAVIANTESHLAWMLQIQQWCLKFSLKKSFLFKSLYQSIFNPVALKMPIRKQDYHAIEQPNTVTL